MTIDDKIKDDKIQCDINIEAAKRSALSGKNDKYDYLTSKETLPSNQRKLTEQARFAYSLSGNAFEK